MCDWIYRILNIKSSKDSSIKPLHNCNQNENCIPMTTYVLGKEFFECHKDIEVSTFALWVEKHHAQWYRINKETIRTLSKLQWEEFLNYVDKNDWGIEERKFKAYIRNWYIEKHGVFSFSSSHRLFVVNTSKFQLLKVLYDVTEEEVVNISNVDEIGKKLPCPKSYYCNWLIEFDTNHSIIYGDIVKYIAHNGNKSVINFKIVNDKEDGGKNIKNILNAEGIHNYQELKTSNIMSSPRGESIIKRFLKYDWFDDFVEGSEQYFREQSNKNPKSQRFENYYSFNAWPQRYGSHYTHIQIGWGNRAIDANHTSTGFTTKVESGAILTISRMETGYISIFLYGAKTDTHRPIEDAIVLKSCISPKKLLKSSFKQELWNNLLAYMECTSLDGNPNKRQSIRVFKLRLLKSMVVDGKNMSSQFSRGLQKTIFYVLNIGLSGCLLFGIQRACDSSSNLDNITNRIDNLRYDIHENTKTLQNACKRDTSLIKIRTKNNVIIKE